MNKAREQREKIEQLIEAYVTVDNEIYRHEIPAIAFDILTAIKENKIPVPTCALGQALKGVEK